LADSEDAFALEPGEVLLEPAVLGLADEKDVAGGDVLDAAEPLDHEGAVVDLFAADGLIEVGAERVVAQYADDQRGLRAGERRRRPFHKLGEVEQEPRLELVFARAAGLRARARRGEHQRQGRERREEPMRPADQSAQYRHVTFPKRLRWTSS